MGELKQQPNRRLYIETLRRMTPEQKLLKVDELTETSRELLRAGIAERHPEATEAEQHAIYLERLERCRKRSC
ncbi:MAG: hypothetical protein U1E26_02485 [Coriobacteriia bacterium]|nr:hypothetical protein [Coriobacteriia bacterium]